MSPLDGAPEAPPSDTLLVAFVGVDGAGKSTLIEECRRRSLLPGARYLRNAIRRNADLLARYHHRRHGDARDYASGGFASVRPFATALDFLDHYQRNIEPLLGLVPAVVCDRYWSSSIAYFVAMGWSRELAVDFFRLARPADLTFYVRVDVDRLSERHAGRGGTRDDEAIDLMRAHAAAFEATIGHLPGTVITVDNNGPLTSAIDQMEAAIQRHAAGLHPPAVAPVGGEPPGV